MFTFSRGLALAAVSAVLCLGAPEVQAQVALPMNYWVPGGPFGFGGGFSGVQGFSSYTSFPSLDLTNSGGAGLSNQPDSWFVTSQSGSMGIAANSFGLTQTDTLGSIGTMNYNSVNFGYNFKDETGASPVTFFGGLDTVNYNTTIGNPFSAFTSPTNTATAYRAHAGVEFKPASNVSLSFEAGFSQQ
jgi:opacity protein-like surface antigen